MKLENIKNGKNGLFFFFLFVFEIEALKSYKVLCAYTINNEKNYKLIF